MLRRLRPSEAFEEFADLEEKHHKDGFRELRFGPRQETDT